MTFYKILDFKYKGRSFTAFRNNLGFQTFLEYEVVDNNRKYHYIDEMTYQRLYDMFLKKKPSFYEDGVNKKRKFNFIPKVISATGTALLLASLTACGVLSGNVSNANADELQLWPNQMFDDNEVIITDDYEVYEIAKKVNLLTVDGLNLYWSDESNITFDDVRNTLDSNPDVDEFLADYIHNFIDKLEMRCPNINLTCLNHNVQILKSKPVGDFEMMQVCGSSTATACFVAKDGTIYYNEDRLDDENFEYIMNHEIGHMLLNGYREINGYATERHFTTGANTGFMIEEGFDTLFIEDVVGVSLEDVAYRLPANYVRIIKDSIGYTFDDYVDGYHIDFENRIKEFLDDPNYNVDNLPYLMEYQKYNIRGNNDIEIEDSEFYELYEVVAGVFFKANIEYCDSKESIIELYEGLIDDILNDVYTKEGKYTFDFKGLREGMRRALKANGIDESLWPSDDDLTMIAIVSVPGEKQNIISR